MAGRGKGRGVLLAVPSWLLTFSDIMTLLLTFFVMLFSIAVIDERSKLDALGSVAKEFGFSDTLLNPTAPEGELPLHTPGRMDREQDLEILRDKIFDDTTKDLNFQENKYVQIFSINDEVLFSPGSTDLSPRGIELLDKLLPYLQGISYPLLVAGHSGIRRDEEGEAYTVRLDEFALDSTWRISYERALAVYKHLRRRGLTAGQLSLEAFGQYRPRFSNNDPDGRRLNRRVDLVLDKRNLDWIQKVESAKESKALPEKDYYYKGFRFNLDLPDEHRPAPGGL